MVATTVHGNNGLIYISGNEIVFANSWEVTIDHGTAEGQYFGQWWTNRTGGISSWSGSVSAFHDQEGKALYSPATQNASTTILIYPNRTDLTTYYSGTAIFGFSASGGTDGYVTETADFQGSGSLVATGFS
jgi:hypothetical protein